MFGNCSNFCSYRKPIFLKMLRTPVNTIKWWQKSSPIEYFMQTIETMNISTAAALEVNWMIYIWNCMHFIDCSLMMNPFFLYKYVAVAENCFLHVPPCSHKLVCNVFFSQEKQISAYEMRIDILLKSICCCFVSFHFFSFRLILFFLTFSFGVKSTKSLPSIRHLLRSCFRHTMRKKCLPFLLCDVKCCYQWQKKECKNQTPRPTNIYAQAHPVLGMKYHWKEHTMSIVQPHICRKHVRD